MAQEMENGKAASQYPAMTLCPDSKVIQSYGYSEETKALYIRFVHGKKLYSYANFPADLYQSMREAPSAGRFFQQRIVKIYNGAFIDEKE